MNQLAVDETAATANVVLKGTARGLEILISGKPSVDALGDRLCELLGEAPAFFAGSDARVAIDGALPEGALTCLERVASRFDLKIVEIGPRKPARPEPAPPPPEPPAASAEGSGPAPVVPLPIADSAAALADLDAIIELVETEPAPPGPRVVTGPVRSGVIVDHQGHVIVVGDVNPGAEIRASGNIIVLGRLRGVAHAAIGQQRGFIVALSLQPQQLRIGRMVARAGDADRPSGGAEIAYPTVSSTGTGETIVVERFTGRLPSGLAASM